MIIISSKCNLFPPRYTFSLNNFHLALNNNHPIFQSSPLHLTEVDTIPDSLMVEEQQQKQGWSYFTSLIILRAIKVLYFTSLLLHYSRQGFDFVGILGNAM